MVEAIGIYLGILIAFIGGLMLWLPRLSRRELFFAVTVRDDFPRGETARPILRRFDARVVGVTLVSEAIVALGVGRSHLWPALAAPILQLAGCFWAFLAAHKATTPHAVVPTKVREATLAPRAIRPVGGWWLQLAPFAVLGAAAAYLHANWGRIPSRFPVHWGVNGTPNGWSMRTPMGVYGPLIFGGVVAGILVLLNWLILHLTRRVHASGGAASAELARERRYLLILTFTEFAIAFDFGWTAILPLRAGPESSPSMAFPLGGTLLLLGLLVLLFVAHRPQEPQPAASASVIGDRTEDRYWKAGVIYVNRKDPAVVVEKRFGIGYTMNFGHWISWLILLLILLVPLLALIFVRPH